MPKRKAEEQFATIGNKDGWQLYGLQHLAPGKFATVVGKILAGKHYLINAPHRTRRVNT